MKIFWAWQFDLPGKIGRHFIRGALNAAIAQINQTEEVDEPDEEFQEGKLHLDYGRKRLKGSPDLANEILKKIDNAAVFVGDVTPVGKGHPHRTDEGVESDGKPLMNPNVAIELGYALKSKGTDHVLMIMNSHYGKRVDMPFDLGHKGGPITYDLAPDATPKQIEIEKRKLVGVLVDALREYVPQPVVVPFEGMKPKIGKGIYFDNGEILAEEDNPRHPAKYTMPFRKVIWLRLTPSTALPYPLAVDVLRDSISRYGAFAIPQGFESVCLNRYGACFFTPAGSTNRIDAISQYTRDGEIWGVHADCIRQGERGEQKFVLTFPIESILISQLSLFMRFMREVSQVPPPINAEVGIEGIAGWQIVHNGYVISNRSSPTMHRDFVEHRGALRSFNKAEQDAFLMQFFNKLNENSGVPRPRGLYNRD